MKDKPDIRIVILHRGFVIVGHYQCEGLEVTLRGGTLRRWGTNHGLEQLASEGPTNKTIIEYTATHRFHRFAEINTIECNEKVWRGRFD